MGVLEYACEVGTRGGELLVTMRAWGARGRPLRAGCPHGVPLGLIVIDSEAIHEIEGVVHWPRPIMLAMLPSIIALLDHELC